MNMSPQEWSLLEHLLDQALAVPDEQRAAYLDGEQLTPAQRAELDRWLTAEIESRELLLAPESRSLLQPGERLGAWRIVELLGRGGSGEVYRVERADGSYEQQAALKLLRRSDDEDDLRRFTVERRLLARLEHPDISRLFDGGVHEGRPYAVIELIDGERLDVFARHLNLKERLALFLRICVAVAHAHRHLIVHRDLKPANVLVTREGAPKLLDFGIAKLVEQDSAGVTVALRLTPDYCAPEQLMGEPVTAAADVFALGVILHELLTGQAPWRLAGSGVHRALDRLASNDLPPPSSLLSGADARSVRGDLDAIVMKALRRAPRERYASAEALADDLRRHLESRPVLARGEAVSYIFGRMLRRHRRAFASVAAVLLALLAGIGGVAYKVREASIERDIARDEASRNAAVKDYLLTLFRVAGEIPGAETFTTKQLLDKGASRLVETFDKAPDEASHTLLALAQLYFSYNDYTGAAPLLERLLDRQQTLAPELTAQAAYDLSQCYLRMSRTSDSRALLDQAQAYWLRAPERYRNQLLESRLTQAQLERAEGQADAGIHTLEQALLERVALSGENYMDTGALINNIGVAYFQANRLPEARLMFQRAWNVWGAVNAEDGVDALNTLNNWAALEVREKNYAEAESLFHRALNVRRALFGPSAALAALLNNLGKLQLLQGKPAEALPMLTEAVALAREFAGENSLNALASMAGLGEAQAATGDPLAAEQTLTDMEARVIANFGEQHLLAAIAHLAQARRLSARGDTRPALQRLDDADRVLAAIGPQAATYTAQVAVLRDALTQKEERI